MQQRLPVFQNSPQGFGTFPLDFAAHGSTLYTDQVELTTGMFSELLRTGILNHFGEKFNRKSMSKPGGLNSCLCPLM